jgi:hypothetical protein
LLPKKNTTTSSPKKCKSLEKIEGGVEDDLEEEGQDKFLFI